MRFCDCHNHLQIAGPDAAPELLRLGERAGVELCGACGTSPEDWGAVLALARAGRGVMPFLGVHPWRCRETAPEWENLLARLLKENRAGVGECGLDKSREDVPFLLQCDFFARQLKLAADFRRPMSVHCVRAWGPLMLMLGKARPGKFLLHNFSGSAELVSPLAALGAYFSFSADISNPRRRRAHRALRAVPPERLLLETDCPPSPGAEVPAWHQSPAGTVAAAECAAGLLGMPCAELAARVWDNSCAFFAELLPDGF